MEKTQNPKSHIPKLKVNCDEHFYCFINQPPKVFKINLIKPIQKQNHREYILVFTQHRIFYKKSKFLYIENKMILSLKHRIVVRTLIFWCTCGYPKNTTIQISYVNVYIIVEWIHRKLCSTKPQSFIQNISYNKV